MGKILRHSSRLRIGYADTIGKRPTMEDDMTIVGRLRGRDDEDFVAVYDGHGGKAAAEFAAKNLYKVHAILYLPFVQMIFIIETHNGVGS